MACGLTVACIDRGAMHEVVADAGVFTDGDDPAALAGALLRALSIPRHVPRRRAELHFGLDSIRAATARPPSSATRC